MSVLGIVPARGGSQRVPGKNLRVLLGRPLVAWVIEAALASQVDHLVVSSDSREVLELAEDLAPGSALLRPADLSAATSPAIGYVEHALSSVCSRRDLDVDAIAILQPSSPFTCPADIDATIAILYASGADSAVTVTQVPHDLHPVKFKYLRHGLLHPLIEEESGRASPEDLPDVYVRNGSVYCTRTSTVAKGSILGQSSAAHVMPRSRSVDINDEFDFAFAEFLASRADR